MATKTILMEKLAAKIRCMDEAALAAANPVPPEVGRTHAVTFYTSRECAHAVAYATSAAEADSKQWGEEVSPAVALAPSLGVGNVGCTLSYQPPATLLQQAGIRTPACEVLMRVFQSYSLKERLRALALALAESAW